MEIDSEIEEQEKDNEQEQDSDCKIKEEINFEDYESADMWRCDEEYISNLNRPKIEL